MPNWEPVFQYENKQPPGTVKGKWCGYCISLYGSDVKYKTSSGIRGVSAVYVNPETLEVWSDYMFADKYDQSQRKPGTPITGPWVDEPEEAASPDPVDAVAAAEPPQDRRQDLCSKLKTKYNLDLDPERITYMGKDGIDYNGDVCWNHTHIRKIPVKFRKVKGFFSCADCALTTLENAPVHVNGNFTCSMNHLASLEHAPAYVGGDFFCFDNNLPNGTKQPPGVNGRFIDGMQTPKQAQAAAEPSSTNLDKTVRNWDELKHALPDLDGAASDVLYDQLQDLPGWTKHVPRTQLLRIHAGGSTWLVFEGGLNKIILLRPDQLTAEAGKLPRNQLEHVFVSNNTAGFSYFHKAVLKCRVPADEVFGNGHGDGPGPGRTVRQALQRLLAAAFSGKVEAAAEPVAHRHGDSLFGRVLADWEDMLHRRSTGDIEAIPVLKKDEKTLFLVPADVKVTEYERYISCRLSDSPYPTGHSKYKRNEHAVQVALTEDDYDESMTRVEVYYGVEFTQTVKSIPGGNGLPSFIKFLEQHGILERAFDIVFKQKAQAAAEPENTDPIPELWCKFTNSLTKSKVVLTREQKRFDFVSETPGDVWGYVVVRELPARADETVHFFTIIDHKLHYDVKVNPHATPAHDKYLTEAETKHLLQHPKQLLVKMLSMLVLEPGKAEAAAEPESDTKERFWCDVVAGFPELPRTRPVTVAGRTYTAGIISHGSTLPSNMHHTHALVLRAGAETYTVNIVNDRVFLIYINDSGATDMVEIAGTEDFHRKHKTDALKLAAVFKAVAAKAASVRKHAQAAAEPVLDAEQLLAEAVDSWKMVKEVPINTNALVRFQVSRGQVRVAYVREDIQAVAEYRVLVRHDVLALVPLMPGKQRDLAKNIGSVANLEQAIVNAFKHKPVTAAAEPPADSGLLWYDVVDRLPEPGQTPLRVQAHGTVFELTQLLAPNRYQPPLKRNPANAASALVLVEGKKYSISIANARIWVRSMDTLEHDDVGPGIYEFERKHRTAREKIAEVLAVVWRLHKAIRVQAAAEPATAQTAAEWHARVRAHLPGFRHKARLYRVGNVNVHVRFVSAEGIELTVSRDRVLQALITARPFGKIVELYALGVVQESAEIKGNFNSAAAYVKELLRASIKLAEKHNATAAAEPEPLLTRQQGVDYVQTHVHVPAGMGRTNMLDVGFHFGQGVYLNFRDGKQAVLDGKIGGSSDWSLLIEWCGVNLFTHTHPTVSVLRSAVTLAKHVSDYVNAHNTNSFQQIWAYLSRYRTRYGVKTAPKSALLAFAERSWEVRRGRVEAAAEPAQDPREVLCQKLKAKYNLHLDPSKITYMGRDGIDYGGSVNWSSKKLSRIPVRFRKVTGYFSCSQNRLTTLEHAPGHVGGDFSCYENHLTGLEHAPGHVGGDFYCYNNHLTTLEHAPGHVGGDFYCYHNHLPPGTKKPVGVKGRFYFGIQTPAPVHGAVEPYPEGEGSAVAVIRKLWKTLNPARRVRVGKYEVVYRTGAHSDSRGVVVDLVEGDDLIAQIKAEPVYEYIGKRERSYVRVRLLKGSVPVPGLAVVNNITTSNSMLRFLGSAVCKHAGVRP